MAVDNLIHSQWVTTIGAVCFLKSGEGLKIPRYAWCKENYSKKKKKISSFCPSDFISPKSRNSFIFCHMFSHHYLLGTALTGRRPTLIKVKSTTMLKKGYTFLILQQLPLLDNLEQPVEILTNIKLSFKAEYQRVPVFLIHEHLMFC